MVELLNGDLEPTLMADGASVGAAHSTDQCSGSAARIERCTQFGLSPVLRGLYATVAAQIDVAIADEFETLRAGTPTERATVASTDRVSAAVEWIARGREAGLPSFADMLRERGAPVPETIREMLGMGKSENVTVLAAASRLAASQGALYDEVPIVVEILERLYPAGIEQVDALVGLLLEPPTESLVQSVGPTLGRCIRQQVRRTRSADRFWYQNNVVQESELGVTQGTSLLRNLMLRHFSVGEGVGWDNGLLHDSAEFDSVEVGGFDGLGAPPALPFYALLSSTAERFVFESAPPAVRKWQATLQPLPTVRISYLADNSSIHLCVETPNEGFVGIGFGPRFNNSAMAGADMVLMALREDGTVALRDAYAALGLSAPFADVELRANDTATAGGAMLLEGVDYTDHWQVNGSRTDGVTQFLLSRARDTGDEWDNVVPQGMLETLVSAGTASLAEAGDETALFSAYHGPQRVVISLDYTTPPPELDPSRDIEEADNTTVIIVGAVVGGLCCLLLLGVMIGAVVYVRRARQQEELEAALLLQSDAAERLPPPSSSLQRYDLNDVAFALEVVHGQAGLYRDPVTFAEFNVDKLIRRRKAQADETVAVRGQRVLPLEEVFCDVLQIRNRSLATQQVSIYLPDPVPQFRMAAEPLQFKLSAGATRAVVFRVRMLCTTKQKAVIRIATETSIAELPPVRLESELSTVLDFDELRLIDRIGEGEFDFV